MKATKPTVEEIPCFECTGTMQTVYEPYTTRLKSGQEMTLAAVPVLRCGTCGESLIGGGESVIGEEGNQMIDSWLRQIRAADGPLSCRHFQKRTKNEVLS